jgi:hypothetical protein
MLQERDRQSFAEEAAPGEPPAWKAVYALMRCFPGSCELGPHCWQDPYGKKHYKLNNDDHKIGTGNAWNVKFACAN